MVGCSGISIVFVLVERWAERNEVSQHEHLCFVENDLGGAVQAAGAGREAAGRGGKEGLLECGNRCEMKQAGVQSTHCPWH